MPATRPAPARAARIRLLVLDVDGVLTDGALVYGPSGEETKRFYVRDGLALQLARSAGIEIAILSGRASAAVTRRMSELGIVEVHQGVADKRAALLAMLERLGIEARDAAVMGDDLPDIAVMKLAGLGLAPSDAARAASLPDSGKTSLWKVTVGVQDSDRTWKVTSEEGDLIKDTKDVELRGNVVLISSEGLRVETSVLRWNNAEGRAWTDQPVTIYKGGGVVTGFGLDARPSDEIAFVRGRVKATFGGPKDSGPAESKAPKILPPRPAGKEASRGDGDSSGQRS